VVDTAFAYEAVTTAGATGAYDELSALTTAATGSAGAASLTVIGSSFLDLSKSLILVSTSFLTSLPIYFVLSLSSLDPA